MAFTRTFLKTMNLSDEQISAIMEEHVSVTDALKKQRDEYKAEAEKLPDIQKKLDDMKGGEDYKAKYEAEHKAYEDYKTQVKAETELNSVKAAYRKLLTEEKISDKRLDAVVRLTDFSKMKLNKDGTLENTDALRESIRKDWSDYVVTTRTERESVATPPNATGNAKLTRNDIYKKDDHGRYVLSAEERQKAIMDNPEAFR